MRLRTFLVFSRFTVSKVLWSAGIVLLLCGSSPDPVIVGILGDVHGNLSAAKVALSQMRQLRVNYIIGLGDFGDRKGAGGDARAREILSMMSGVGGVPKQHTFLIAGNWETDEGNRPAPEVYQLLSTYGVVLSPSDIDSSVIEIAGKKIVISHAPKASLGAPFTGNSEMGKSLSPRRIQAIREGYPAEEGVTMILFGDTHRQAAGKQDGAFYVNPGALASADRKAGGEPNGYSIYYPNEGLIELRDASTEAVVSTHPMDGTFSIKKAAITLPSEGAGSLAHEIVARISKVSEFEFVRAQAEKMGVKSYLFGDSASTYGHYVKWDLLREAGDNRYLPQQFDYDFTHIFRPNQPCQIVIDGTPEQALELQKQLTAKYPPAHGSKSLWQVQTRHLADRADTGSTGLIEINPAANSVSNLQNSKFFVELREGKLSFDPDPKDASSIKSVISYLNEIAQFDDHIPDGDFAVIKEIVTRLDPKSPEIVHGPLNDWIEENGKKLFQNAANLAKTWDLLDGLGLREKLAQIRGDTQVIGSLAWLMNRVPLRRKPLGQGTGPTARELAISHPGWLDDTGKIIVAHVTSSKEAYDAITSSPFGEPNFFDSRQGRFSGERGGFGSGVYASLGSSGVGSSGFTIRMELDPLAREGSDFTVHNGTLLIKNNCVRIIHESANLNPLQYFQLLATGQGFKHANNGALSEIKRRVWAKALAMPAAQEADLEHLVREQIETNSALRQEWLTFPLSQKYPKIIENLLRSGKYDQDVIKFGLSHFDHPDWAQRLFEKGKDNKLLAKYYLSNFDHPPWVQRLIKRTPGVDWSGQEIAQYVFTQFVGPETPNQIRELIDEKYANLEIAKYALNRHELQDYPDLIERLIRAANVDYQLAPTLLLPHWQNNRILKAISSTGKVNIADLRTAFKGGKTLIPSHEKPAGSLVECIQRKLAEP